MEEILNDLKAGKKPKPGPRYDISFMCISNILGRKTR